MESIFKIISKVIVKKSFLTLFAALILVIVTIFVYSCTREGTGCESCDAEFLKVNTQVFIKKKNFPAYSDNGNPETILISKTEDAEITKTIRDLISSLNLIDANSEYPIGLCLFFEGSVDTKDFNGLNGVLFYNKVNDIYLANFWERNKDNIFTFREDLSGISNIVSKNDMYRLNSIIGFDSNQLLLLLDQTRLATNQYPSVFQVKTEVVIEEIDIEFGGIPNMKESKSMCSDVPSCKESMVAGYCTFQEGPLGTSAYCNIWCPNSNTIKKLSEQEQNIHDILNPKIDALYEIRNSLLLPSEKGKQYIDDYYYSSLFLHENITLDMAYKLYKLYELDFFTKLSRFDNENYNDMIVIDDNIKPILLDICNSVSEITMDSRFNSIVNRTKEEIDRYYNKGLVEIKKDFKYNEN